MQANPSSQLFEVHHIQRLCSRVGTRENLDESVGNMKIRVH